MGNKLEQMVPFTRALNKSHLMASGFSYEDLDKPIIAVANSWNEFNHGHTFHKELAAYVKAGISAAGGLPVEFNTPAPCDGLAVGNPGMHYILPTRELVADVIEATVSGHPIFDGLVLISSCDKITPGMLIAASRLKIPTIHIAGGPSIPAISFSESRRLRSQFLDGQIGEKELAEGNALLYSTPGSCPYIGTANTMTIIAEALGLALPGSALAPPVSSERMRFCTETGRAIVRLVELGINSDQIITQKAFLNAIRVAVALGGSANFVMHLLAIARQSGVDLSLDQFGEISRQTPQLAEIAPNGPHSVVDLHREGGIPVVMKIMASLLDLDTLTVTGKTLGENLELIPPYHGNLVCSLDHPINPEGGITILHGNLALEGAVVKSSAVPKELHHFQGPARVFTGEQECIDAVQNGEVQEGEVLVVKNEGPVGGPGMREMHRLSNILRAAGLRIALLTDGRFSGADSGLMIGYISPEAAVGGLIGLVRNGDTIIINLDQQSIHLDLSDAELSLRRLHHPRTEKQIDSELLKRYIRSVGSASEGAVW
jgi:dihydroxy-acid dehydratase